MEDNNKERGLGKCLKEGAIFSALGLISLPVAGAYLGLKKNKESMIAWVAVGVMITYFANHISTEYQKRPINLYKTGKVTIQHKNQFSPNMYSVDTIPDFTKTALTQVLTNAPIFQMLDRPANNKVTTIRINGISKGEEFICTYEMPGFIPPQEINIGELTSKYVSTNPQTGESHEGLCKQVFREERKYF